MTDTPGRGGISPALMNMYDMIGRKSNVSGRDILKEALSRIEHTDQPNLFDAIQMADELMKRFGLWVRPEYLLDVWTENNG